MGTRYGSAVATVLLLGGCGVAGAAAGPVNGPVSAPTPTPTLCAEFPPQPPTPGDPEGWWSSTPADANGNVLTDPAQWPAQLRDHPRTVVLDPATGRVISSWDRRTCGPIPDFPAPSGLSGTGIVVLDADSGAVLERFPASA